MTRLRLPAAPVKPIYLPHTKYAVPTYYLVATAEASANLARFDGVRYGYRSPQSATLSDMYSHSRDEGFGAEVKRRIFLGTYALSAGYYDAYYLKAQQVRRILAEEFLRAFAEVDAIVTPTSPFPAFKLGEKADDPLAMYLADIYTVTASLAGICGVTVPCGTTKAGLPVGMQVLASHLCEGTAFRVARAVEDASISFGHDREAITSWLSESEAAADPSLSDLCDGRNWCLPVCLRAGRSSVQLVRRPALHNGASFFAWIRLAAPISPQCYMERREQQG